MKDQAQGLRNMVKSMNTVMPQGTKSDSRVYTITSGKGGVGKTNITVNLAIALKNMGKKVLIIDADLGLSNVEVLFGTSPRFTVKELIEGKQSIEAIIEEGPFGVSFISGGSGIIELANLDNERLIRLVKSIEAINRLFDIILIDTGAGISSNVLEFVMISDEAIVVTTPEPTAITDAYAIIKAITAKAIDHKIDVLINRANNKNEADEVFYRLSNVIKRFLKRDVEYIGYMENSDLISKSVKRQMPFIICYEKSNISNQIEQIAKKIVAKQFDLVDENNKGLSRFVERIIKRLQMKT